MTTFVISNATAASQTEIGECEAHLQAQGVFVDGRSFLQCGAAWVAASSRLVFDCTGAYAATQPLRFDFDSGVRPVPQTGHDSAVFGTPLLANVAQGVLFQGQGVGSLRAGAARFVFESPLALNFVGVSSPVALHFALSGGAVLVFSGVDEAVFGRPLLPSQISAPGVVTFKAGNPRLYAAARQLLFDLTGVSTAPALSFAFGGPIPAMLRGSALSQIGMSTLSCAAQAVLHASAGTTLHVGVAHVLPQHRLSVDLAYGPSFSTPALQFAFGEARSLVPGGLHTAQFGDFAFDQTAPVAIFQGLHSFVSGDASAHSVAPSATPQFVGFEGTIALSDGLAAFTLFEQTVSELGAGVAGFVATPRVSRSPQVADVAPSFDGFGSGFPTLAQSRTVDFLAPFDLTQFGVPRLSRFGFEVSGFASDEVSSFVVSRSPRHVVPFMVDADRYGEAAIYNLTQYIRQDPPNSDPDTYRGAVFGRDWQTFVLNRNRTVTFAGVTLTRFASRPADFTLAAQAFIVRGSDQLQTQTFPNYHQIAYHTRHVGLHGTDTLRSAPNSAVSLAGRAFVLAPTQSAKFGVVTLERLLRLVSASGLNGMQPGVAWVSRAPVLTDVVCPRDMLATGRPLVGYRVQSVSLAGVHGFRFTDLQSIVKPPLQLNNFGFISLQSGEPTVRNVTPQLYFVGRSAFQSGDYVSVGFFRRYLAVAGIDGSAWGIGGRVADTRQSVSFAGEAYDDVCTTFLVQNVSPSPPNMQRVIFEGEISARYGLAASVRRNSVELQGSLTAAIGNHTLYSTNIVFDGNHFLPWGMLECGTTLLSGGARTLSFTGLLDSGVGMPRVSPHTIWFRHDAPLQAVVNHGGRVFEDVGVYDANTGEVVRGQPFYGVPTLTTREDVRVHMSAGSQVSFGSATVVNKDRRVLMVGSQMLRYGYPVFLASELIEAVFESYYGFDEYGVPSLENRNRALSFDAAPNASIAAPSVQLYNRELMMVGSSLTQWGANEPMVHYPRRIEAGADVALYGVAWVSRSPRSVQFSGASTLTTSPTLRGGGMRVRYRNTVFKVHAGNDSLRVGGAAIASVSRPISVYGINPPCIPGRFVVRHAP